MKTRIQIEIFIVTLLSFLVVGIPVQGESLFPFFPLTEETLIGGFHDIKTIRVFVIMGPEKTKNRLYTMDIVEKLACSLTVSRLQARFPEIAFQSSGEQEPLLTTDNEDAVLWFVTEIDRKTNTYKNTTILLRRVMVYPIQEDGIAFNIPIWINITSKKIDEEALASALIKEDEDSIKKLMFDHCNSVIEAAEEFVKIYQEALNQ